MLKRKVRVGEVEIEEMKDGTKVQRVYGRFHLGAQYDINIWS
jgi:hypothetical protein